MNKERFFLGEREHLLVSRHGRIRQRQTKERKGPLLEFAFLARQAVAGAQDHFYQNGYLLGEVQKEVLASLPCAFHDVLPWTYRELSGETKVLDPSLASHMSKMMAKAVHLLCHNSFERGIDEVRAPIAEELEDAVALEESYYLSCLMKSRAYSLEGNAADIAGLLEDVMARTTDSLGTVLENASSYGVILSDDRSGYGVRISAVARRMAMLAAALVQLQERLRHKQMVADIAQQAESRNLLRRNIPALRFVPESYGPPRVRQRVLVVDRLANIQWNQDPSKPYSEAETEEREEAIHIPCKRLSSLGCVEGIQFWARGSVKKGQKGKYFEVEIDDTKVHQDTVWEDWLASEVRDIYNLHLGGLHMEWEFPCMSRDFATLDYFARVNNGKRSDAALNQKKEG